MVKKWFETIYGCLSSKEDKTPVFLVNLFTQRHAIPKVTSLYFQFHWLAYMTVLIQQIQIGRTDLCCRWEVCSKNPRENLFGGIQIYIIKWSETFQQFLDMQFFKDSFSDFRNQTHTVIKLSCFPWCTFCGQRDQVSVHSRILIDFGEKKRTLLRTARIWPDHWLRIPQQKVSALQKYSLLVCETLTVYLFNNTLQKTDLAMILL